MSKRIPQFSRDYPVWAWTKRPDLRQEHINPGEKGVLLTIAVPKTRVLISDFSGWHHVLGKFYLPLDTEKNPPNLPTWDVCERSQRDRIVKSWERIFTPRLIRKGIGTGRLQACVDRVYLKEVAGVRPFIGRGSRVKRSPSRLHELWLESRSIKP